MNIILYTIGCTNCDILEKQLQKAGLNFIKISDEKTLIDKGFGNKAFPILEVDGVEMSYRTATEWLRNIKEEA